MYPESIMDFRDFLQQLPYYLTQLYKFEFGSGFFLTKCRMTVAPCPYNELGRCCWYLKDSFGSCSKQLYVTLEDRTFVMYKGIGWNPKYLGCQGGFPLSGATRSKETYQKSKESNQNAGRR